MLQRMSWLKTTLQNSKLFSDIFFSSGGLCQGLCPYTHISRSHWWYWCSESQKSSFFCDCDKRILPWNIPGQIHLCQSRRNILLSNFKPATSWKMQHCLKNLETTSIIYLWLSSQRRWMQSIVTLQSRKLQNKSSRQHQIHCLLPTCFSFRLPFPSSQGQIAACPKFQSIEGPHRKVPVSQTKAAFCYSFPVTAVEFN